MSGCVVFDIQRFSIHDGPGIRTTVFLKGCPLRCLWCQNPESQRPEPETQFSPGACVACGACLAACPEGAIRFPEGPRVDPERCVACGTCAAVCTGGALRVVGREMSVAEVLAEVLKDQPYYERSGGGLTLSGGEPLLHGAFVRELTARARALGLHVVVETCGQVSAETLEAVAPAVDLFYFDLKHLDPDTHRELTGLTNRRILENATRLLELGAAVEFRYPLIPGLNDDPAHLDQIVELLRSHGIDSLRVVPYQRLYLAKLDPAEIPESLRRIESPSAAQKEQVSARFAAGGIRVVLDG